MKKEITVITFGLVLAACSTAALEPSGFPAGKYVDEFGIFAIFNPDGSYEVELDGEIVSADGRFSVEGNEVTIIDNTIFCGAAPGVYEWSVAQDGSLELSLVSDPCEERVASMTGSLTPAE